MTSNKTTLSLDDIAHTLAINSKASGIQDFGCLYDDDWDLSNEDWMIVCEKAEKLIPVVEPTEKDYADWRQANRDVDAEKQAEAKYFGY